MRTKAAVAFLLVAIFTLTGCGSSQPVTSDGSRADIQIVQTSGIPSAARHVQGPLQVEYAIRVTNRTSEQITLERINIQSQLEGAYHIAQSLPFNITIPAGGAEEVTFKGAARTGQSLVGANGPVTLRVTAEFGSPTGGFREIATRVVNPDTGITGEKE